MPPLAPKPAIATPADHEPMHVSFEDVSGGAFIDGTLRTVVVPLYSIRSVRVPLRICSVVPVTACSMRAVLSVVDVVACSTRCAGGETNWMFVVGAIFAVTFPPVPNPLPPPELELEPLDCWFWFWAPDVAVWFAFDVAALVDAFVPVLELLAVEAALEVWLDVEVD